VGYQFRVGDQSVVTKVIAAGKWVSRSGPGLFQLLIGNKFCLSGREKMRGHRILTLFAVEVAAMFALCAATSVPAASSTRAFPGEHLQAASSRAGTDRAVHGKAEDPSAAGSIPHQMSTVEPTVRPTVRPTVQRTFEREFEPKSSEHHHRSFNGTHQNDDTSLKVKVHQDQRDRSHFNHQHSFHHFSPPWCFHCHGRHHVCHHVCHHVRPYVRPAPRQVQLPVTGRASTTMALGGVGAILTGAALLWLSSGRRKRLSHPKSAVGSAA
jgi:LPXTG-motif cell wall-anchored protein